MNVKTRRELIEEAFDAEETENEESSGKVDETASDDTTEESSAPDGSTGVEETTEESSESVDEKETKAAEKDDEELSEREDKQKPVTKPDGSPLVTENDGKQRAGSAPISWDEKSKAAWNGLPQEVREQVAKREIEVQRALTYSSGARKFAEDFQRTVQPFAHLIQARGSTPLQAVHNLMNTAAGLTVGTPQQKADIVADIILTYGLDTEILDTTLAKALQNRGKNVQEQIPPHLMQALKPVFDAANQLKQREQQDAERLQAEAFETIESMATDAKYPFFNDLREDIADILQVAMQRGRKMTLPEAYRRAVNMSDKHRSALDQREKASRVTDAARTLAGAKKRASATVGAPSASSAVKKAPTTRREAIEAAWEESSSA